MKHFIWQICLIMVLCLNSASCVKNQSPGATNLPFNGGQPDIVRPPAFVFSG